MYWNLFLVAVLGLLAVAVWPWALGFWQIARVWLGMYAYPLSLLIGFGMLIVATIKAIRRNIRETGRAVRR
jgi:TRAP-type C4-dicarboxylate transport system permease small subunit